jgi:hypothetical protein
MSTSEQKTSSVIKKMHPFKAAGSDGIPFFVLIYLGSLLVSFLKPLLQACINISNHTTAFCHCDTIPLRKQGKGDYPGPRTQHPVAPFKKPRKVLVSVIAPRFLSLSEELSLLPAQLRGACPCSSIDTTLDFLVEQIYTTWQNKDSMATLLLLDPTRAFNRVVPAQLLHHMRKRRILECTIKRVSSFISNRSMTLCLPVYNTTAFPMHTCIF